MNKIDKRLHFLLGKVKEECKKVKELSDFELKNKTLEFKERLNNGETTDDLLPEAFAVCCEADYRVLGMFPYDVQILGGIALHLCYLCEMNTGEGKTLTATMPMYLNGLTGKSYWSPLHVMERVRMERICMRLQMEKFGINRRERKKWVRFH